MKATVVDLRYKMNNILKALERNESVTISHRGAIKGTIIPIHSETHQKVEDHPFFGSSSDEEPSVEEVITQLRKPRQHAL